jgi:DNA-binding response OmpR family regulator
MNALKLAEAASRGQLRSPARLGLMGRTAEMEQPDRILIVDDDEEFASMLGEFLRRLGFFASHAGDGWAALQSLEKELPDLIVLDIMMPGLDGLEALRTIRRERDLPIIMVTARGQAHDRILGLELGADDYLAKPFDPNELAARIRAVLRRLRQAFRPREPVCLGPLELNPAAMTARLGPGTVRLTAAEFLVLEALAGQPGVPQTREALTERALGRTLTAYDRSIDTHVSNIRRKLGLSPAAGVEIRSIRGGGYCLALAPESA